MKSPAAALVHAAGLVLGLVIASVGIGAEQLQPTEYQVKAVFLYNFGRVVEWPAASAATAAPFFICVLGRDPFGTDLDKTLAGGTIGKVSVAAKRIAQPKDALGCRILFISSSEEHRLKEILAAIAKSEVLTVSDIPQFSLRGGMIQFVMEHGKVRFEVNLTPTVEAGLTLSSELLKVAANVRRNQGISNP